VWSPRFAIIAGTANVPPNDNRPDRRRGFDDHREAAALAAHANSKPCIGCALLGRD